jgi:hypothetical protein
MRVYEISKRMIPVKEVPPSSSPFSLSCNKLAKPTIATPATIKKRENQWKAYYFRPSNNLDKRAVITTIIPRII